MYVFENGKIINKKAPQKNLTVMFIGEFCTGKSTLINALLRRKLLKTSFRPETAVLTKIVNGKSDDLVTVTFRDPERPDAAIPYEEYKEKFCLDEWNYFNEISYVTVTAETQNKAVTFIDSPSNALYIEDIISLARKADVVVMVLSARKLGGTAERECIQKLFAGRGLHNVFFAINWYNDLRSEDTEEFSAHLKDLIGCAFTDTDRNFNEELYKQRVFPIDAYTSECARTGSPKAERKGLKFIKTPVDPEEDAYTGVPELEQALNQYLEQLRYLNINRLETGKIISKTAKKATEEKPSREFQVMFVGGFATGMLSLIEALLRHKLPIHKQALVLKIVNGKSDLVTITFCDHERPDLVIPYEQYNKEFHWSGSQYNLEEIAYVTVPMEMPSENITFVTSTGLSYFSEITNAFWNKSDATVMVLSALRLGSDMEREFIQRHFAGRNLHNVYFVVTNSNVIAPSNLKELIGCAFTDADGNFNETLYKQRVFLVDAHTSFCARTGAPMYTIKDNVKIEVPISPEVDRHTGVPELEQALELAINQYICELERIENYDNPFFD